MSKPGIISKSEEITEKRKIYQSLKHLCETEPECCRILVHMDFILEGAYRFVQDQKRPQETVEHTLKNWMDSMKKWNLQHVKRGRKYRGKQKENRGKSLRKS